MESMGRDHTRHLMFFYLTFKPKKMFSTNTFFVIFSSGIEPRGLCMFSKHSTTEPCYIHSL